MELFFTSHCRRQVAFDGQADIIRCDECVGCAAWPPFWLSFRIHIPSLSETSREIKRLCAMELQRE
jgi:hypothetical protein